MLFYKGSEDEEWYEGTVCRCEMRTLASGQFPYYDIRFNDDEGVASFSWIAPHKDNITKLS